jgi:hypothetical protein
MASPLTAADLLKEDWRLKVFIGMMKSYTPFKMLGRVERVKFQVNREQIKLLSLRRHDKLANAIFVSKDGRAYRLREFERTSEFVPLARGVSAGKKYEKAQIDSLNSQINEIRGGRELPYVPLIYKGKTYRITACENTPKTPKSDFHLLDENDQECFWISYKSGQNVRSFHQYGGVSERAGPEIDNHPEVKGLGAQLRESFTIFTKGIGIRKKIKDNRLSMLSIYGRDYGKSYGQNNVQYVMQGPIKFVQRGDAYVLHAPHMTENGDLPSGDYLPALWATFRDDRHQLGIRFCRATVSPWNYRVPSIEL